MHTYRDGVIICTVTLKMFEGSSPMLITLRPAKSMTKFVESINSLGGCMLTDRRIFLCTRSLQGTAELDVSILFDIFPVIFPLN